MKRTLSSLTLAGLVLLAGCATRPATHWNASSVGERLEYHFLGIEPQSGIGVIEQVTNDADAFTLTVRRHILNDNPHNPLQNHPYEPGDRYIPIVHGTLYAGYDFYDLTATTLTATFRGLVAAGLSPVYWLVGTGWTGDAEQQPPDPDSFEVHNP